MARRSPLIVVSRLAAAACLLALVVHCNACTGRTLTDRDDESLSASVTLHTSPSAATLSKARGARTDGRYEEATRLLESVYLDTHADTAYRAQALFDLGQVHAELLNPHKDYSTAIAYFEELIREYPDSDLRHKARNRIEAVQELQRRAR
ncbi:MAG: tetratricopeptide repeat protein [Candidatus Eisenbacteria bacterium]|nr:tetratricopeptide repeat protein [Candidatus Eisenbacteria bacterium]